MNDTEKRMLKALLYFFGFGAMFCGAATIYYAVTDDLVRQSASLTTTLAATVITLWVRHNLDKLEGKKQAPEQYQQK